MANIKLYSVSLLGIKLELGRQILVFIYLKKSKEVKVQILWGLNLLSTSSTELALVFERVAREDTNSWYI
jgi:hypothetical protein